MLLYFMDLFGKVTEKNFSIEQFFKATLRCVTTYIFISNSIEIVGYLMDAGSSLSSSIASYGGYNFFTTNHKVMFINSFNSFSIAEILSYIMNCLIDVYKRQGFYRCTNEAEAVEYFLRYYERPGEDDMADRIASISTDITYVKNLLS